MGSGTVWRRLALAFVASIERRVHSPVVCGLAIVGITIMAFGCEAGFFGDRSSSSEPIQRSKTDTWELKRSSWSGLEIEVPNDLCFFGDEPDLGVAIQLHSARPARGTLDDEACMLELLIKRVHDDQFRRNLASVPAGGKGDPWVYQPHYSISRKDERSTFYRYDVRCPNGDVLWTLTNVAHPHAGGKPLYEEEDDAIVRRMLGSLKCVDGLVGATPQDSP